jgi:hypothetical protein
MASEKEEKGHVSNTFLNPIGLWQKYLTNWIETSRGFYENAIKALVQSILGSLVKGSGPRTKRNSKGRIAYHLS